MLRIIDALTGYRDREAFDRLESVKFEITHSPFKLAGSIRNLLNTVKEQQIKYVKISANSVLNRDADGKLKKAQETSRHFFDFLTANMIYDIILNSDSIICMKYIKTYLSEMTDIIDNFEKYPYDFDDFNRMNYGIFVNDSKEYGGNCQVFSMIYELINVCHQNGLEKMFVGLCSDSKFKKYFVEVIENADEFLKPISLRNVKNSRLNVVFWLVAVCIMTRLNKINDEAYVITSDLLQSGFEISPNGIKIKNNVRKTTSQKINCVFYICEEHCHVGVITPICVFDIDNMNNPSCEDVFIDRACEYYDFDKTELKKLYYNNYRISL